MLRVLPAVAGLLLAATPALAELRIDKVEASHGRFGPVRKSLDFYPYDEVVFRFTVAGARVDDDGKVDAELSWTLHDDKGKEAFSRKLPLKGPLALGSESFPAYVSVLVPEPAVSGEYALKVRLKDNLGGGETSFERKLNLKATEFAIIAPRFFHDSSATVPAPAAGVVGQHLFFRFWTIGFDRSQGKLDNEMTVQVLDKAGKELLPKPLRLVAENNDAKVVKELPALDFGGSLMLNQPGEFTVRMTVTDRISKKTDTFEVPLEVTAP
jgi:hypothetical protein